MTAHLEAEQAVLGSIMLDGEVLADINLRASDFEDPRHASIYGALRDSWDAGDPIDVGLVGAAVELLGVDRAYFASLAGCVRTPAHAAHYSKLVQDAAQVRGFKSLCDLYGKQGGGEDAIREMADQLLNLVGEVGVSAGMGVGEALDKIIHDATHGSEDAPGLPTGYPLLDFKTTGGMRGGEFWLLAGRPSMGKSSFANNIVWNVIRNGGKVGVFSLEVDRQQVTRNIVSIATGIRLQQLIGRQRLEESSVELIRQVRAKLDGNLFVDDRGRVTAAQMRSECRGLKRRRGLDLVVVDYIQLMETTGSNRQNDVSQISRGLKLLARELGVPVIGLSQLNRKCEERADKRPMLSDLRESGSLEQDADFVGLMFRPFYYSHLPKEERDADITVAKQRNGPTGRVPLEFDAECVRFKPARAKTFN